MKRLGTFMFVLVFVCAASALRAEVSILHAPDGDGIHLLKITRPEVGMVWSAVSTAESRVSVLNAGGDDRGDLAPAVALLPRVISGPFGNPLAIPWTPDFEARAVPASRDLASVALPAVAEFDLVAVWSGRLPDGYRLIWSRWLQGEARWSAPSPVSAVPATADEVNPDVILTPRGFLLTWTEDGGPPAAHVAFWNGRGFTPAYRTTAGDGASGTGWKR